MPDVKVYGADWCSLTTNTRAHLDKIGVPYQYIDIDNDRESAKWVADHNNGKEKKPTLDIAGEVLSVPSNNEVDQVLKAKGLYQ